MQSTQFNELMTRLELLGIQNDEEVSDRKKKYLNITRDTGELFSVLVKLIKPKNILEVGTSNGYSSLWFAASMSEGGCITTIERNENKIKEAKANFLESGLNKRIEIIAGEAMEILPRMEKCFDIVFLDSDRDIYEPLLEDIIRLTVSGGLIIFDNAISHRSEFVSVMTAFNNNPEFTCSLLTVGKGEFLAYKH